MSEGVSFTVGHDEVEPEAPPRSPSPVPFDDTQDDPMGIADDFVPPRRKETPPAPEPLPRSRRTTVEEVPDEGDPENFTRFVETFEGAGKPLRTGQTLFEQMRARQKADGVAKFSPFQDGDEWDLARWLSKHVSQTATEEYLEHVNCRTRRPNCHSRTIAPSAAGNKLDENDELMSEELELWMRDPERVYGTAAGSEESRIFDEMWTAEWWWKLQVGPRGLALAALFCPPTRRSYPSSRATRQRGRCISQSGISQSRSSPASPTTPVPSLGTDYFTTACPSSLLRSSLPVTMV